MVSGEYHRRDPVFLSSSSRLLLLYIYILRLERLTIESIKTGALGSEGHGGMGPFVWVYHGLEKLGVEFVFGTEETRRLLFDQLCYMKELTSVAMGSLNPAELQWHDGETPRTRRD